MRSILAGRGRPQHELLSTTTVCWCDDCPATLLSTHHAEVHARQTNHTVLVQRQETTIYDTRSTR